MSASSKGRHEHLFFSGMAVLLLATVFVGFASSYYLAGMVNAPLPSAIVHVHALVATSWMLLFAAQVSLISARRVDLHRRLGIMAVPLACAMVVTGLMAGADILRRGIPPGQEHLLFLINTDMVFVFAVLVALGYRMRGTPQAHKRLIVIGNVALMFAAFIRWPVGFLFHNIPAAARAPYGFLLLMVLYDLWSMRRIHPVTLWAGAFLVFVFEVQFLVAETMAWRAWADWVKNVGS
ncbi:hypothetical protein GC170_08220 [bacterium]|nr:hypothetical protein [bacterium]